MNRSSPHPTRTGPVWQAVPDDYRHDLAGMVRALGTEGRGDDARGRYLASLYALEWAFRRGVLEYRPRRDPGRWMLLLLDVGGARAGLAPDERLALPLDAFLERLAGIDLPELARITREHLVACVARSLATTPALVEPLVGRMSVASVLYRLGVTSVNGVFGDKHPQARHFRRVLRERVDEAWAQALTRLDQRGPPSAEQLLASLPVAFDLCARTVRAALLRVGEDLAHVPFAVFYALVTDARRGGRVWRPADRYVEGGCYDRASFELAVGHSLEFVRSRKRRYRRSSALSELGLSAIFPNSIARIDEWLERGDYPVFRLDTAPALASERDWYAWALAQRVRIAAHHDRLVDAVTAHDRADQPGA